MRDKDYGIATIRNYDEYQRGLASMVYKLFNKKAGLGKIATSKAGISVNEQLKSYKNQWLKNSKERKVSPRFTDNICEVNSTRKKSLSLKNKNVKYLLYVIYACSKYA